MVTIRWTVNRGPGVIILYEFVRVTTHPRVIAPAVDRTGGLAS
jgi:hypothetical protein